MRHLAVERSDLNAIIRRLEIALASAIVCDLALKRQNVERDHEIAAVMRWSIIDPLSRQIETLGRITHTQPGKDRNQSAPRHRAKLAANSKPPTLHVSRTDLDNIGRYLSLVASSASVCSAALETQHAEADVEVATMLRHPLVEILHEEIARIRSLGGRKSVEI